jgi:type I restriction enzyme M protein
MASGQQQVFPIEEIKTLRHRNRKNHNQYFTPEFAVEKALSLVPLMKVKNIIDPAVGNGIFLKIASKKWGNAKLFGVDIDPPVIQDLKKTNLPNLRCFLGDSLLKETYENPELKKIISNSQFDLVVGNPPFSSWFYRISEPKILRDYKLSQRNGQLMRSQAIEVLFIEIFIKLARERGYIVIVLPDGILSNPQYRYVREFILSETEVKHIINLPRNVFENTSAKTSILILEKKQTHNLAYFVKLYNLEKSVIFNHELETKAENLINRMDYWFYHNLKQTNIINELTNWLKCVPLSDIIVYCKTGKTLYGRDRKFSDKGLRFLHATNITEIGINYKKDEKFIDPLSKMNFQSAYAKVGDILFVRVGVGCAGRVAIVDVKEDEGVATDYIHIFKVKNINPYYLVVYLKTRFGKDYINILKHGVGTVSINKTDLLSLQIPLIPEEIQEEIEKNYRSILSEYRRNGENKTLMDKLISLIHYLEKKLIHYKKGKYYVEM